MAVIESFVPENGEDIRTPADTLFSTIGVNPQQESEVHSLADKLGIPVDAVRLDLPRARQAAKLPDLERHPAAKRFLSDDSNMAQAQDDIVSLQAHEDSVKGLRGYASDIWAGAKAGANEIPLMMSDLGTKIPVFVNKGFTPEYKPAPGTLAAGVDEFINQPIHDSMAATREFFQTGTMYYTPKPEERPVTLPGKVVEGIVSAAGQIPIFMAGGEAVGSVKAFGLIQAIQEGVTDDGEIDSKKLVEGALKGAETGVALEVANFLPKIIAVPAIGALFGSMSYAENGDMSDATAAALTMGILGMMGKRNPNWREDLLAINQNRMTPEIEARLTEAVADFKADPSVGAAFQEYKAIQQKKSFDTLLKDTQNSKVAQNNKPLQARFIQSAVAEHGSPEKVYFQAQEIRDKIVESGMKPDEAREWLKKYGITERQMDTAVETGGPIGVETGKFVAYQADDVIMSAMKDKVAFDKNSVDFGLTPEDMKAAQSRLAELDNTAPVVKGSKSESQAIIDSIQGELVATGMSESYAKTSVSIVKAYADAWSGVMGKDSAEKLKQLGITVKRIKKADFINKFGDAADVTATDKFANPGDGDMFVSLADTIRNLKVGGLNLEAFERNNMGGEVRDYFTNKEGATSGLVTKKGQITPDRLLSIAQEGNFRKADGSPIETVNEALDLLREHIDMRGKSKFQGAESGSAEDFEVTIDPKVFAQAMKSNKVYRGATVEIPGGNLIAFFAQADSSTFLHEMGHIFLADVRDMAIKGEARGKEWDDIKKWLGVKSDKAELTTEQQEKFAKGFEKYLMEGKAPSAELRTAFAKFSQWLTALYTSLRSTLRLDANISDDVRSVFDRLLATEEQIRREQSLNRQVDGQMADSLEAAGVRRETIQEYIDKAVKSRDKAREELNKFKFKGMLNSKKAWKKQAIEEVKDIRYFKAIDGLRARGINRDSIIDRFGKDIADKLPKDPTIWRKDGVPVDIAAVEAGYELPDGTPDIKGFVDDMVSHPSKGSWIKGRAAKLEKDYLDSEDAQQAFLNEFHARELEIEEKMYAEAARKAAGMQKSEIKETPFYVLRKWAREKLASQSIKETLDISSLETAVRQQGMLAWQKGSKGQWLDAFNHKQMQRRGEALITESYAIKHEYDKYIKKAINVNKAIRGNAHDLEYSKQLAQFMNVWMLTPTPHKIVGNVKTLGEFMADLRNDDTVVAPSFSDFVLSVPADGLLPGERSWSDFQRLMEAVQYLDKQGRVIKEGKLYLADQSVEQVADVVESDLAGLKPRKEINNKWRRLRDAQSRIRKFTNTASMLLYNSWALGGYKAGAGDVPVGPIWDITSRVMQGEVMRNHKLSEWAKTMKPSFDQLSKTVTDNWGERTIKGALGEGKIYNHVRVPDVMVNANRNWMIENIVAVALHRGNAENLGRIREGYGLSDAEIDKLTSVLSRKDWEAVQGAWDVIESTWEETNAVHERLYGFSMPHTEFEPVTVTASDGSTVNLKGGYFPVFHDAKLSGGKIKALTEREEILQSHDAVIQSTRANSSFAKERSKDAPNYPVLLDPDVIYKHLHDKATFITLSEAVKDYDNVIRNGRVDKVGREILGHEQYDTIRPGLVRIMHPDHAKDFAATLRVFKKMVSAAALGLNTASALRQLQGAAPIASEVGLRNYATGMGRFLNPTKTMKTIEYVMNKSPYMMSRWGHIDIELAQKQASFKQSAKFLGADRDSVMNAMFIEIKVMDTLTTIPGWIAAYEKGIREYGNEAKAVAYADAIISGTQGGSMQFERSYALDSKNSVFFFFTNFMSQSMMYISRRSYMWDRAHKGQMTKQRYLTNAALEWMLPMMATTALMNMVKGQETDASDIIDDLILNNSFMSRPFIRDIARALINRQQGYASTIASPIENVANRLVNSAKTGGKAASDIATSAYSGQLTEDPKAQEKLGLAMLEIISLITGIRMGTLYRNMKKGQKQIDDGDGYPGNYVFPRDKKKED